MENLKTQFGLSATADFDGETWTFEMDIPFKVRSGKFAIMDKNNYDELLEALKEARAEIPNSIMNGKYKNPVWEKVNKAIKKATE